MRHRQQTAITVHQVIAEIAEHHGEDDRSQNLTRSQQHMPISLSHMATYGVEESSFSCCQRLLGSARAMRTRRFGRTFVSFFGGLVVADAPLAGHLVPTHSPC